MWIMQLWCFILWPECSNGSRLSAWEAPKHCACRKSKFRKCGWFFWGLCGSWGVLWDAFRVSFGVLWNTLRALGELSWALWGHLDQNRLLAPPRGAKMDNFWVTWCSKFCFLRLLWKSYGILWKFLRNPQKSYGNLSEVLWKSEEILWKSYGNPMEILWGPMEFYRNCKGILWNPVEILWKS